MPILEPKTICPGFALGDAKADYKSARRVGQYKLSAQAVYFPAFPGTRYLPFSAVIEGSVRDSVLPTSCSCGKELPVFRINLRYDGGAQDFMFETAKQVELMMERLRSARPDLPLTDRRM